MKTLLRIVMITALVTAVSPKVMAIGPALPDGGSSAILVALGAGGLLAARRLFGKK